MEPSITLFSVIMLLGAAQGLFLALALINAGGGNHKAHRFLALLTLVFAVDLGLEFLYQSRYLLYVLELAFIEPSYDALYGPLAYLYVHALTSEEQFRFGRKQWLHFLPFAIGVFLLVPLLAPLDHNQLYELIYLDPEPNELDVFLVLIARVVIQLGAILQIGIYLTLAIRRLIRHARVVREQFSAIEQISLIWLKNLLIALGVLYLIYLFDAFLSEAFGFDQEINRLLYLMTVGIIYTMGYMGLRQPLIFFSQVPDSGTEETPGQPAQNDINPERKRKYERSALDEEMSAVLRIELEHHMNDAQPHLDSKLTLSQLATQLGISTNYLSQVINEQMGKNFFDFINHHRVGTAKQLLSDETQTEATILTIALEAGFNSKSAFYTAFRKHANITPSQFRQTCTDISNS